MKRARREVGNMIGIGTMSVVGAKMGTEMGGTAGTQMAAGMTSVASGLSTVGTVSGAGMTLRQMKKLKVR